MAVGFADGYQCASDLSPEKMEWVDCKDQVVQGRIISSQPRDACRELENAAEMEGAIVFVQRGSCSFAEKVKNAEDAGAAAVIVANSEVFERSSQVITV